MRVRIYEPEDQGVYGIERTEEESERSVDVDDQVAARWFAAEAAFDAAQEEIKGVYEKRVWGRLRAQALKNDAAELRRKAEEMEREASLHDPPGPLVLAFAAFGTSRLLKGDDSRILSPPGVG